MNTTARSESTPAAEAPLTRAKKEELIRQIYSRAHWIELIRLFRYQTLPMDQAREAIKPLAEQFGKDPVASACEVLVEISMQGKDAFARLKPHIRRMAFQILGPEPPPSSVTPNVGSPPPPDPQSDPDPPRQDEPRRAKKPAKSRAPGTEDAIAVPEDNCSAIMQQYRTAKDRHPGMLLLFRMGDFFELFGEDAETAHKLLGLTLTTRDRTLAMAGFPHHQLEAYLRKLLHEGQRVAICEPVEESLARGPIRREVTRVVTPSTMLEEDESEARTGREPEEVSPRVDERPIRQPRCFVLKQYEAWLKEAGLAFVSVKDVGRTTPAVAPHVSGLDFIVLRGDEKLLVTVRPHLQEKHHKAIRELQGMFGPGYKPLRIWPSEGPAGWNWHDYPVAASDAEPVAGTDRKQTPRRSRANKPQ